MADSLDEFIAEARRIVLEDPAATITSPDGRTISLIEFLANWDAQHAAPPPPQQPPLN